MFLSSSRANGKQHVCHIRQSRSELSKIAGGESHEMKSLRPIHVTDRFVTEEERVCEHPIKAAVRNVHSLQQKKEQTLTRKIELTLYIYIYMLIFVDVCPIYVSSSTLSFIKIFFMLHLFFSSTLACAYAAELQIFTVLSSIINYSHL